MASSIIHMCVANEINKKLHRDKNKIILGSIAPDISKHIGETKLHSHFLDGIGNSVPNMEKFLSKYKAYLDDDFVMGYYIHLYTDYIWFKYFLPEVFNGEMITTLDGEKLKMDGKEAVKYIYNDYTNLNIKLLDEYDLDLSLFYEELPKLGNIIEEIPMDKLQIIVDQCGIIIENTKENKAYVFDTSNIIRFIKTTTELCFSEIENMFR